jgi:hypothetical protein
MTSADTLSQKQFGKYYSAEIFPASMGILPVLFLENFYSAISKEEVPLAYGKISLP